MAAAATLSRGNGTMRWRGSGGVSAGRPGAAGTGFLSGLSADDLRSGHIRVLARSPSGRTQQMDVIDVDGMYNTNFTPDEVGDWSVSVLYGGRHIDGSPFHVRVYDPGRVTVFGLDAGLASRNYSFTVSAGGAGEGSLTLDITHNGQIIPAQISPDPRRSGEYTVHFVPQGSGYYTIRIFFADVEVAGSPYTVEVIDASAVSASGAGLTSGQVQHRATFTINTGHAGGSPNDCRVSITDQRGSVTPSNVIDQHDGTLRVEFVPLIVGDHKIDILYYGKPISGSPFYCKVCDWSQINVNNLTTSARVGKLVEFDINAAQAGTGDLEIMINGGTVQCDVQQRGNRQFHASFTPRVAITHEIQIKFNGQEVAGSPWRVDVANSAQVTVVGAGLQQMPVGVPAWFEVRGVIAGSDGGVIVNITSPSRRMVRSNVTNLMNGVYRYEYTPTEAGLYSIEVLCDGVAVAGSPFSSKAYDIAAITCSANPIAFVDKVTDVTVDASRAGEGQLEITINRGSVQNSVRPTGQKGVYIVSFTPKEAKIHTFDITFNGESCKSCCLAIPAIDVSQVQLAGHLRPVCVNKMTSFRVSTQNAGDASLAVQITSPNGNIVQNRISGTSTRGFDVEYTPLESGDYTVDITYGDAPIPGCPFQITAYDINRIKVFDLLDGIIGQETSFKVDISGTGHGELQVTVGAPSGAPVTNYIRPISQGTLGVFYTPSQSGVHLINLQFNGEIVPGSPFRATVVDPSKAMARGDGLDIVQCGQLSSFFVTAPSAQMKDFDVKIIGPNSRDVTYRIAESGTNNFKVDYTPINTGDYRVEVNYLNMPIPNSPFVAKAWDVNKVTVTNIVPGRVGAQSCFNINVKDAGEGTLEIGICGPSGQNVSNTVTALGPGLFVVSYIPLESGSHRVNVTFNGECVNGNPFQFMVNDPSRVVARGEGLNLIRCGQSASFIVTAPGAQLKDLDIRVTAPNNRDIIPRIAETGANNFKVTYSPTVAGDYTIDVSCFDQAVVGSPFIAHASDISRVLTSNIATGIVGQQSSFSIDVRNAGDCTLEISICGPSGQVVSNNVDAQSPGLFLVTFVPVESGQHRANITFNKESIQGNPFIFMVIDPMKVTARGDGLGLIRNNQMTSFIITAPAAHLSDLDVVVTGPSGKQVAQRVSDNGSNNTFKVDYTPVLAGDHQIEVLYFGQPITGSPFVAKVWDSSKVIVSPISSGCVGNPSTFTIDVKDAGEGTLEIGISGPSGQNIPNNVLSLGPAQFEVAYSPVESGVHRANITFNKENVFGSPFQFLVTDSGRVAIRGDGIGVVKVNQMASFLLTAPAAQLKDIEMSVTGPNNKAIIPAVFEQAAHVFKCDYTPTVAGDYKIEVNYFGQPIHGSPFVAKAWDPSKVVVSNIPASYVGSQTTVNIDARDAGDGTLEINITGPSGRSVANTVTQLGHGRYEVVFAPAECGQYLAAVTFNKENVPGSKFAFLVTDPAKAGARGDGLGIVRCNQQTQFSVTAPGAQLSNISVQIIGPDDKDVVARLTETSNSDVFLVEYLPVCVGHYTISVSYFNQPISGSPFIAKAWNASAVAVTGLKACCIGEQCIVNVNTSRAGDGNLEVVLSSCGEIIPHTARNLGNGTFDITFIPQRADIHLVIVKFNGEMAPGSPFSVSVIDGSKATATGEGVVGNSLVANKQACFQVNTKMVGAEAPLDVCITSPRGQKLTSKITGSSNTAFNVDYTPVEAGRYIIDIKYAGMPIMGSPFYPEVFDPYQVRVGRLPIGFIGKPVLFDVDASVAGEGRVVVDVRGQITRPLVDISQKAPGIYMVSFTPQESVEHTVLVTFNSIPVPGSPFSCCVIDVTGLSVKWDCVRMKPVHQPVVIEMDPKQTPEADVTCVVTDPQGLSLVTKLSKTGRLYKAEFTGHSVGEYHVDLRYGGIPVPGSPFTCNLYDVKRVHMTDVCTTANVGQPSSFTVDIAGAGLGGDLDVDVFSNDLRIPTQIQSLGAHRNRYTFVPMSPFEHVITVKYNDEHVPGSPMLVRVINPAGQMSLSGVNGEKLVSVGHVVSAIVCTQGVTINPTDLAVKVTAPNGEPLVTRLSSAKDSNIQIEYTSRLIGVHRLDVQYAGQTIHGSPLVTEFFDPSKILVEGTRTGTVGEQMILDVLSKDAGKADLLVSIRGCSGTPVHFELQQTPRGYQVRYLPTESGTYSTTISYGGIEVPGCPISQQIEDCFMPTASGNGLVWARENTATSFTVDSSGRSGELAVTVEGPNSIARCNVERDQGGVYKITYTPVEVGVYNVIICWNGRQMKGCPFKPKVCNPDKLMVVGGWQNFLLVDNKMQLELNKVKRIEFDSAPAGPGELAVEVTGPSGQVPVDITSRDSDRHIVSFLPTSPGDYSMNVSWCQQLLQRCPVIGTVAEPPKPIEPQPCPTVPVPVWDVNDVVLIGQGLTNARVQEVATFTFDGSRAGPGEPIVKLMGLKCDIDVRCEQIGPGRYQCCYTPELPGAYLLSVSWGACQVPGSPFKVTVSSGSDPSKVSVSGSGLAGALYGQELEFVIDTRKAGTGELSATCRGPSKPAYCKLEDQNNGTFKLQVTPQEIGNHQLKVTFNNELIPGAPFNFNIGLAADASKVRVSGPGIESGILATFQSSFVVETRGAGPGRLTVKVRGPKGAFKVEMAKDPDRDRAIICRYNPTDVGQYILHVKWSDEHVPGSPFPVTIVDTMQELDLLNGRPQLTSVGTYFDGVTFGGNLDEQTYFGGRAGSVLSGIGGGGGRGRYDGGDGMSTLNGGDGLIFGDDY